MTTTLETREPELKLNTETRIMRFHSGGGGGGGDRPRESAKVHPSDYANVEKQPVARRATLLLSPARVALTRYSRTESFVIVPSIVLRQSRPGGKIELRFAKGYSSTFKNTCARNFVQVSCDLFILSMISSNLFYY